MLLNYTKKVTKTTLIRSSHSPKQFTDTAARRTRRLRHRAGERAPVTEPEAAPASPAPGAR